MPMTSRSFGVRAAISATLLSSVVVSPMKAAASLCVRSCSISAGELVG